MSGERTTIYDLTIYIQIPSYFFWYNTPFTPPRGPSRGDRLLHLHLYMISTIRGLGTRSSVYVSCACTYVYIYNQYKKSVNTEQIRDALHLHSTPFYLSVTVRFWLKNKTAKKVSNNCVCCLQCTYI